MDIWFCSDHHIGHKNIIKFEGPQGDPARTLFNSIEEHNEALVENHNSVVKPEDKVFMLGDVCWNSRAVQYVKRMNGRKILIMGNHDNQKANAYLNAFQDIKGVLYFNDLQAIMTHIPVHPGQLEYRFKCNIHGHLHSHTVGDPRYLNVAMEQINYTPINLDEVKRRLELQENQL